MNDIIENFKFLVVETQNQVSLTEKLLSVFSVRLFDKIASKDDYIDNLKTTVENKCFSRIHGPENVDEKEIHDIRAVHIICVNLERICDYCVNIARQTEYLSDYSFMQGYSLQDMFAEIHKGLSKIIQVYKTRNLGEALEICRVEFALDSMYKQLFDRIMKELTTGQNTQNLITVLFIIRYLERIGDSILNIGEGLIFSIIGDRIKIRQIEALQKTLSESGFKGTLSDIDFSSIWGSRSGCRISRINQKNAKDFKTQGIFKEGDIVKVRKEMENIKAWDSVLPGLTPRVFGYYEKTDKASLLIEFLSGCTLDEVLLTHDKELIQNAIFILENILMDIWEKTRRTQVIQTDYMEQIQSRIEAVNRIHPYFFRLRKSVESLEIPATDELITACAGIESELPAPFSVFIHGDFNINNVVYNHVQQRINYIDLYRSRDADYVQDASVFLVSNFRMPLFDSQIRQRLDFVIWHFYKVFSSFAKKNNDDTFEARLALALARSFYTSIRFELNYDFAKNMYLRSHYLMEKVLEHKGAPWNQFKLPTRILYY